MRQSMPVAPRAVLAAHCRRVLLLGLLAVVLGASAACADTSHAPPMTTEVEQLRSWLLLACGVAIVAWVGYWVAAFKWGVDLSTATAEYWVHSLIIQVLGTAACFTALSQIGDWSITGIHAWGLPGTLLLGVGSFLAGLMALRGLPFSGIVLFGVLYPRPEILPLVTVPALVGQILAYLWSWWRLLQALRPGREL